MALGFRLSHHRSITLCRRLLCFPYGSGNPFLFWSIAKHPELTGNPLEKVCLEIYHRGFIFDILFARIFLGMLRFKFGGKPWMQLVKLFTILRYYVVMQVRIRLVIMFYYTMQPVAVLRQQVSYYRFFILVPFFQIVRANGHHSRKNAQPVLPQLRPAQVFRLRCPLLCTLYRLRWHYAVQKAWRLRCFDMLTRARLPLCFTCNILR